MEIRKWAMGNLRKGLLNPAAGQLGPGEAPSRKSSSLFKSQPISAEMVSQAYIREFKTPATLRGLTVEDDFLIDTASELILLRFVYLTRCGKYLHSSNLKKSEYVIEKAALPASLKKSEYCGNT